MIDGTYDETQTKLTTIQAAEQMAVSAMSPCKKGNCGCKDGMCGGRCGDASRPEKHAPAHVPAIETANLI